MKNLGHSVNGLEYHDYYEVPAISNSFLSQVKAEAQGRKINARSAAFRFGKNIHEFFLEPHKYDFRLYTGRERIEAMRMRQAFYKVAGERILDGDKEVEYFYDFMGYRCKMKADVISRDRGIIIDLKTTAKTTEDDFKQSVIQYEYNRQAAWYLDAPPVKLLGINTFRIIGIMKVKPYNIFTWELHRDSALIEAGRQDYLDILAYIDQNPKYSHLKSINHGQKEACS